MDMNSLDDAHDIDIYGVWTDSVIAQTKVLKVDRLIVSSNSSFVFSTEHYGQYENQSIEERSSWREHLGSFVLSTRDIYFLSKRYQFWDVVSQTKPETRIEDQVLFPSCTYVVVNDTLTLMFKNSEGNSSSNTDEWVTRKFLRQ